MSSPESDPESDPPPPARAERRSNRLEILPCAQCARGPAKVMLRTEYVLYLRCEHCGNIWTIRKPDAVN